MHMRACLLVLVLLLYPTSQKQASKQYPKDACLLVLVGSKYFFILACLLLADAHTQSSWRQRNHRVHVRSRGCTLLFIRTDGLVLWARHPIFTCLLIAASCS
jgi:hypothetical protein